MLEAVEAERCTSLYGVPTMFIAELEQPDFERFDLSSLRTGIMGGAPCPVEVMKQVRAQMHMDEVTIVCGMTETSPVSTQTALDDPLEKRVDDGRPRASAPRDEDRRSRHRRDRAARDAGRAVHARLQRDARLLGRRARPRARAIDAAGWMHTGDLAVMDDDGYVSIVGRIKDMIIRGGENIYPREIEEFLHSLPEVSDAQVIGVPSERYGEEVMAWVKLRDGATLTEERADRGLQRPDRDATRSRATGSSSTPFPMTVTGKIAEVPHARDRDRGARAVSRAGARDGLRLHVPRLRAGRVAARRAACLGRGAGRP